VEPAWDIRGFCLSFFLGFAAIAHAQGYQFKAIFVPGSTDTNTAGMNNAGDVVDNYVPSGGNFSHGYVDHLGTFSDVYYQEVNTRVLSASIPQERLPGFMRRRREFITALFTTERPIPPWTIPAQP